VDGHPGLVRIDVTVTWAGAVPGRVTLSTRAPMMRPLRGNARTTLAEVLVAVLFVSILSTMTVSFVRTALLSVRTLAVEELAVQEEVVMVVDLVRREVRMAGLGRWSADCRDPCGAA